MVDVKQEYDSVKKLGDKKKGTVHKELRRIDRPGGIFGGISTSGGGILSPNADADRERAWLGSTALQGSLAAQAQDPFTLLQQQLFNAANNISAPTTPLEQLRKLAEQQVNAQYQPQIDALMAEMGAKGNRAHRDEKTARDMYGALSKDYLSQLPALTAQYKAEDDAANARYDQAQQQMNAEYQKNAQQQQDLMKQLGIQAAAPGATAEAQNDNAYFNNQMEMDQQSALSALAEQQMAQQDYTRNLGNSAKMAGENLASDIGRGLEDYLTQANSQLTSLQGQRGAAIEALLGQMQQQDAANAEKARQQQFENMMQLYNFQLNAAKASNSANGGAGGFGSGSGVGGLTTGLQGATNYLASQYPNQPILATDLMSMLNQTLQNPDVTNGKFVLSPGNEALGIAPKYSDTGQEKMMEILRQQFEGQGSKYSPQDINATMNALLAYLGKLR